MNTYVHIPSTLCIEECLNLHQHAHQILMNQQQSPVSSSSSSNCDNFPVVSQIWAGPERGAFRASPAGGQKGTGRSTLVKPASTAPHVVCIVSNDQGYGKVRFGVGWWGLGERVLEAGTTVCPCLLARPCSIYTFWLGSSEYNGSLSGVDDTAGEDVAHLTC